MYFLTKGRVCWSVNCNLIFLFLAGISNFVWRVKTVTKSRHKIENNFNGHMAFPIPASREQSITRNILTISQFNLPSGFREDLKWFLLTVYFHETVCTSKHCTDSGSDTHSNQPIEFKPNRTDVIHDWPLDNY